MFNQEGIEVLLRGKNITQKKKRFLLRRKDLDKKSLKVSK
jgi:hypothetical protein